MLAVLVRYGNCNLLYFVDCYCYLIVALFVDIYSCKVFTISLPMSSEDAWNWCVLLLVLMFGLLREASMWLRGPCSVIVTFSTQLGSVVFVKLIPLSEETLLSANITSPEQLVTGISVSDTTDSLTPLFAFSKYNFFKLTQLNGIEMFMPIPFKVSYSCALVQLAGL